MTCHEILVCERSRHFSLTPRNLHNELSVTEVLTLVITHSDSDTRQHIVHEHVIDVILPNEVSD